ncbi:GGDEF domain-containing protein, partial [Mizugakiibacter sediminis]|uniref:GGDEF domain-containing protein n=1 Tax=Mizugakiibacter sediminis TaxID=1475481 RepID=UPI000785831F
LAEITHERDLEALDRSLLMSLAELVPLRAAALYKLAGECGTPRGLAEVARAAPGGSAFAVTAGAPTTRDREDAALAECLASRLPLQCPATGGGARLLVPLLCDGHALGALAVESMAELAEARLLVEGFARVYANYVALLHESERDKLTGLYNRRTFDRRLQRLIEQQRAERAAAPAPAAVDARRHDDGDAHVWLAIFDIDHFKRINDTFGHVYGDEVILMLSQRMKACFRRTDLLFRFGGEEFVVLLEPAPEAMARRALERFRESVAAQPFPQVGTVTVSLGYARMAPGDYPMLVLDRADKALYYAKQHGRNRTCGYEALVAAGELEAPHHAGSVDLF